MSGGGGSTVVTSTLGAGGSVRAARPRAHSAATIRCKQVAATHAFVLPPERIAVMERWLRFFPRQQARLLPRAACAVCRHAGRVCRRSLFFVQSKTACEQRQLLETFVLHSQRIGFFSEQIARMKTLLCTAGHGGHKRLRKRFGAAYASGSFRHSRGVLIELSCC